MSESSAQRATQRATQRSPLRPRITLVSRVGCHLCEVGRDVVVRVAESEAVGWVEVDVDADPELHRRWTDRVPVVLVDGEERDFGHLDEARLRAALRGRRWWQRK